MRIGTLAMLIALVALPGAETARACGDKFLLVGRGAKFRQAYAAIHPASIVVFAQPQQSASKAMRDPRLQADLKAAGHRVAIAEDESSLARMLAADRVDVVLTDAADADLVTAQTDASPSHPLVLPVLFQPSKQQAKAVDARDKARLTTSDRPIRFLSAIDDAMKTRVPRRSK
jgi:hypothetical protein